MTSDIKYSKNYRNFNNKMQIHLNPKNIATLVVFLGFVYLAFIIFGSDNDFPELNVELKDVIRLVYSLDFHPFYYCNK